MKLFSTSDASENKISVETYKDYFLSTDYIVTEDLTDFFVKIKSIFSDAIDKITFAYNDKMTYDINKDKIIYLHAINKIKFTDIAPKLISKPNNFKGYYIEYLNDLYSYMNTQLGNIFTTIEKLKYFISYYINEYKSDVFDVNTSLTYFKNIEKQVEKTNKEISSYFKANDHSTKDEFKRLYKTLNDVNVIYKLIENFDKFNLDSNIKIIEKESKNCMELVDTLIDNNLKARGKLINDEVKKNLTFATYVTAKQIEIISYLFANLVSFYGVFKNNLEDMKEFSELYEK